MEKEKELMVTNAQMDINMFHYQDINIKIVMENLIIKDMDNLI